MIMIGRKLQGHRRRDVSGTRTGRARHRRAPTVRIILESGSGTSDRSEASDSFVCTEICHSLLLGDTCESGKGTEIIARLTDIRSGEILTVKDVYSESKARSSLIVMAKRLEEGMQKGKLIGEIRLARRILKRPRIPEKELSQMSLRKLKGILREMKSELYRD